MLDRRSFIKGSVAGIAGLTTVGLVAACGNPQSTSDAESDSLETPEITANVTDQQVREVSAVVFEKDIKDKVEETMEADIVVLGSGAGGLSAAVKAAELGASVILLEKAGELGGSTNGTEGMFGYNSPLQLEQNIEIPPIGDLIEEECIYSNYRIDTNLWKRFINASGKTVEWLLGQGYEYEKVDVYRSELGDFKCFHWWKGGHGDSMIDHLEQQAVNLGVTIMKSTPGVCLMTEGKQVVGAYAPSENAEGYLAIKAKAVIEGTGGFGQNFRLIEELTVWDMTYGQSRSFGTGDGVIMSKDLGADTYMCAILPKACVEGYDLTADITLASCINPLLYINNNGDRFMNEALYINSYSALFVNAIISQRQAYAVFDQATVDRFMSGDGMYAGFRDKVPGTNLPELQSQLDECIAENRGNVFKADTMTELAEVMGISPENMERTVADYNKYCSEAEDPEYLKDPKFLVPIEVGPFYSIRLDPMATNTIGGLQVNYDNAVINTNGEVIPGLYSVGVDSCMLYKETYNYTMSGGLVSYSLYSGLTSAQHAFDTYCT